MDSERVPGTPHENWRSIDQSLRDGVRGLRGGASLGWLLARYRGARNKKHLPDQTVDQLLKSCDVESSPYRRVADSGHGGHTSLRR